MQVHLYGSVKRWSDLSAGTLFGVMLGGEICVGIKAAFKRGDGQLVDRCVMLTPNPTTGTPHVYPAENLTQYALMELTDAVFVPGELSVGRAPNAGEVVQTADGLVLTVAEHEDYGRRNTPSVNLATGAYSTARPQQDCFGFKGWKIILPFVVKGADDLVLCEWPRTKTKAVAA